MFSFKRFLQDLYFKRHLPVKHLVVDCILTEDQTAVYSTTETLAHAVPGTLTTFQTRVYWPHI